MQQLKNNEEYTGISNTEIRGIFRTQSKPLAVPAKRLKKWLPKKQGFPLMISLVNVGKSAGNCELGHLYKRNS